jgi:hypothetical protein
MTKGSIEWEHNQKDGLVLRIKPPIMGLDAGEVKQHARAARKEMLLTFRSLIDAALTRTDEKEEKAAKSGKKIKVE